MKTAPFDHIAVCVDNSDAASVALDQAWRLRQALGARHFSLVHVIVSPIAVMGHGAMWVPDPSEIEAGAKEWLELTASSRPGADVVLLKGYPAAAVCDWAAQANVDLIVASSSRGVVDRVLLGSFAGYLSRHAPCSILLTRPHVATSSGPGVSTIGATGERP